MHLIDGKKSFLTLKYISLTAFLEKLFPYDLFIHRFNTLLCTHDFQEMHIININKPITM